MNKKFILIPLIILAVGAALFWIYREQIFSKDILSLEILGPKNTPMGDGIEYTVKYKNSGNFVLENVKIVFNFPENTLNEDGKRRFTQDLEDIHPGQGNSITFKGILIGKEDDMKTAHAVLSYTPRNLSSRYESEAEFTTTINSVPIILDFDLPAKVEQREQFTYTINYFSSVDYPLENLSIQVEHPSGFELKSSDPESLDDKEWKLETLEKSKGGKIFITGAVDVSPQENLQFSMKLGMWQSGDFIVIKEAAKEIQVIEQSLVISQFINGVSGYAPSTGEVLRYEILLKNNGNETLSDLPTSVQLESSLFDFSTISSSGGDVKSGGMITFDPQKLPSLKNLRPNQEARIEFNVTLKSASQLSESEKADAKIENSVQVQGVFQKFPTKVNVVQQAPLIDINLGN